jgi:hypothetical protein
MAMLQSARFLETLLGGRADRFPYFDLEPAEDTVERWRGEGLPPDQTVAEAFGLETHHPAGLNLRSSPRYVGPPDLLDDPAFFAAHYDPETPSRYEEDFIERCGRARREGRVVYVDAWGGGILQMLGVGDWSSLECALLAMMDRPVMVERIVDHVSEVHCRCLERVLSKVEVDYATFYEPIASPAGPVISPVLFERIAIPGYRKVLALLERHGVRLRILCTTGGDLTALLPSVIDAGMNGLWISNIKNAGMAYPVLRRAFGSELALIGGIDSDAVGQDKARLRKAVEDTVPGLLRTGRYLPCLDDRPRKNMPFALYKRYRRMLEDIARGDRGRPAEAG